MSTTGTSPGHLNTEAAFAIQRCRAPMLDAVYSDRLLPLETGERKPLDIYIPQEQGHYLYSLIRHYRPMKTVEIGMANGLSSAFIAQAIHDNGFGSHVAIDPFQSSEWNGTGMGLLRLMELDCHVRLIEDFSHQALALLEREQLRPDFIFIDGAHVADYVMADFLLSDRILEVGGLLVFDDSDWPAVRHVIRYILANRHYEVAHPEIVIEPPVIRPSLASRALRSFAKAAPSLAVKLRPEFLVEDQSLGILGRCVALRKLAQDDRNSQDRSQHVYA